jgi:hypothetical protein
MQTTVQYPVYGCYTFKVVTTYASLQLFAWTGIVDSVPLSILWQSNKITDSQMVYAILGLQFCV